MSRWKRKIPKEGVPTHWITTTKGESVEVYSEPVFIAEGGGTDHFFTKGEGEEIIGRIAPDPFEEYCDLTVALVPVKRNKGEKK